MKGKIELLMEETGCERGEAELALEMYGYNVEAAVRQIPRLLNDICALKGKFVLPALNQHGLFLVVLNLKTRKVLRARAVMSYDPAVCGVSLDEDWFVFEKYLYGCRLWDGSLPAESQEVEQSLAAHFRGGQSEMIDRLRSADAELISSELMETLGAHFHGKYLSLKLKKDILDLGQFQTLRKKPVLAARKFATRTAAPTEELLVLKISLDEDPQGSPAAQLRAGDLVFARIVDGRDIAQYLARLFGGLTSSGPAPIEVPIEAVETASNGTMARVRFAVGVVGDVVVPIDQRLKTGSGNAYERADGSWWRRFFKS